MALVIATEARWRGRLGWGLPSVVLAGLAAVVVAAAAGLAVIASSPGTAAVPVVVALGMAVVPRYGRNHSLVADREELRWSGGRARWSDISAIDDVRLARFGPRVQVARLRAAPGHPLGAATPDAIPLWRFVDRSDNGDSLHQLVASQLSKQS